MTSQHESIIQAKANHRASEKQEKELNGALLFLLAGFAALGALATNIILPAFPDIALDLGITVQDLSATLSSFFIAFAFGQLFVGPLSDRFGRKWLVLGGLCLFAAGSLLCLIATTLPQLILGRIIQAIGVCATAVLSRAIARDLFDGDNLARVLSLIMVSMAAAPGFSPLLGSALNSFLGWRTTFVFVGALALLLAILYLKNLGETHQADKKSSLAIPSILLSYGRLLQDKRFIAPAMSVSLVLGGLYTFFSLAPAILMTQFGLSSLQLGIFFALTVFVVFASGFLAPRMARARGQVAIARLGILIAMTGSLGLLLAQETLTAFSISIALFLLGMGLLNPLATAIALHPFGKQAGAASALLGFLQMGCAAIAIMIGGSLGVSAYTALSVILMTGLVASFFIFLMVRSSRPLQANQKNGPVT